MQAPVLSEELQRKATNELHENADHVKAHLESFKRWIASLPHITCQLDDSCLLAFLRQAKYNHSKAQTRFDNFCTVRKSSDQGRPQWFSPPPLDDPRVTEYFRAGIFIELGRNKQGVQFYLFRINEWGLKPENSILIRALAYMDADRYSLDPRTQIAGQGTVIDLEGIQLKHFLQSNLKDSAIENRIWQDCYPLRTKHIIYFNEPEFMSTVMKLAQKCLTSKMWSRVLRVGKHYEVAYENVEGLKDLMRFEYGGTNGTLEQLTARHERSFRDFYSKHPYPWSSIELDESKRPSTAQNLFRQFPELELSDFGIDGTYIQLQQT